jgi:DNA-binding CsgD family transcriptional regulator
MNTQCSETELALLKDVIRQIPGLIIVSDKESKFMLSNDYTAGILGFCKESDILGLDAFGIKCNAVECADEFLAQDSHVMQIGDELNLLDIHQYADGGTKILLTKKKPFYQLGEVAGSICYCTEVQTDFFKQITANLIQTDKRYHQMRSTTERSYRLCDTLGQDGLSKRESECLFYWTRARTMKEIARMLNISHRTVETYIENIKLKIKCTNRSDMIDYAIANGYLSYIPESVLQNSRSIILS